MTVEPMTDVDRIRAQWVDDLRRAVTVNKHDKHMLVSPLQVACLFKALDAERTRADAAENRALDAEAGFLAAVALVSDDLTLGDLRNAKDEVEKLRARALPEPRLLRTVEEVEALPRGHYLVRLAGETRTRAFDRCGFYPGWEETGDRLRRGNANFVGAWISGPLSLPDLPTPTAAQEATDAQ